MILKRRYENSNCKFCSICSNKNNRSRHTDNFATIFYAGFAGKTQDILATEDFGATGSSGETQCFAETETCDEEAFATDPKETAVEQCDPQCKGCKEWQLKFDELQKLSLRLTIRNAEMDLKFEDLLRAKTGSNQFVPVSDDATADAPQDDVFTERELIYLKCMAYDKEMDSTFIHHCIQYAYKDNASVLVNKTLKGTADKVVFAPNGDEKELIPGKDPLTPLKVEKIRNLFINRISKCQLDAVSYSERIKDAYFNRLIGSAVRNISNKKENKPL